MRSHPLASSLLIDAPQSRPNFTPTPNPALVTQQVVDLRRGLDLLLSRPDVDAARIAYVGYSLMAANSGVLLIFGEKLRWLAEVNKRAGL